MGLLIDLVMVAGENGALWALAKQQ